MSDQVGSPDSDGDPKNHGKLKSLKAVAEELNQRSDKDQKVVSVKPVHQFHEEVQKIRERVLAMHGISKATSDRETTI